MSTDAAIPAATLILARDTGNLPELLMVERAATLRSAGGALVFPGGRVDPGDLALAGGDAETSARLAAIRETLEETGLAVALEPTPGAEQALTMREMLAGGADFAAVLAAQGVRAVPAMLSPFARWIPRHLPDRVFDTCFYVLAAPPGLPAPIHDGGEIVRAGWTSAVAALASADAGGPRLIFPTRRTLERIAAHSSVAAILADAAAWPIEPIIPAIVARDDGQYVQIPEGLGYPVTAEPLARATRA